MLNISWGAVGGTIYFLVICSFHFQYLGVFFPQECMSLGSPTQLFQRAKPESEFRFQLPTQMKISTIVLKPLSRLVETMELYHEQDKAKSIRNHSWMIKSLFQKHLYFNLCCFSAHNRIKAFCPLMCWIPSLVFCLKMKRSNIVALWLTPGKMLLQVLGKVV